MIELIAEIWQTARRNKLRTSLTGFAVAWGIFMLIVLLGAGNGLINASEENNDRYVDNSMVVFGGMTSKAHNGLKEGRDIQLDDNDLYTTQSRFTKNVDKAGAILYEGGATVSYGENYVSSSLRGVFPVDADINKKDIVAGRFINDIDIRDQRKVLIISENQARELIPGNPRSLLGKVVKVGEMAEAQVTCAYEPGAPRLSRNAIVPPSTASTRQHQTMRMPFGYGTASPRR